MSSEEVHPLTRYDLSIALEEDMRAHMYQPGYENDPMNTDLFYGLMDVTPDLWSEFQVNRPYDRNLLFQQVQIQPRPWDEVVNSLSELDFLFQVPNVIVAGGRVFSAMFEGGGIIADPTHPWREKSSYSDVDLFLIIDEDTVEGAMASAEQKIGQLKEVIKNHFTALLAVVPNRRPPRPIHQMTPEDEARIDQRLQDRVRENEEAETRNRYPDEVSEETMIETRRREQSPAAMGSPEDRQRLIDAITRIYNENPGQFTPIDNFDEMDIIGLQDQLRALVDEIRPLQFTGPGPELRPDIIESRLGNPSPDQFLTAQTYDMIYGFKNIYRTEQIRIYETRTANAVTITVGHLDFQIVLRLYRTVSEVLHGFDVDSCALGYDGSHIWATQRAMFALLHGYNTVNFDRLSPSYPFRLVKYALRGMSIYVPDFDRSKVNQRSLKERYLQYLRIRKRLEGYRFIKKMKGLDVLLYAEYHWNRLDQNPIVALTLSNLASAKNDYSPRGPVPADDYFASTKVGQNVEELFMHLIGTAHLYPEISAQYMPHIRAILEQFIPPPWPFYYEADLGLVLEAERRGLANATFFSLVINNFLIYRNPVYLVTGFRLDEILEMNPHLYAILQILTRNRVDFPQRVTFKVTNPGEQMTNTFNRLVLEDNRLWYQGEFYTLP